ncbi:hypothetical protein EVA_13941 [gut metagenome]|uniref:Uncharacterized protein n=1 Tax=gut metagenome TaxID=749906 RepID=J9G838_9ZZZZ
MLSISVYLQHFHDQCHAHKTAEFGLTEISSSGILVHCNADFIYAGQRMHHNHVRLCKSHFFRV